MAIVKNPKRNLAVVPAADDRQAEAFISGAGQQPAQPSPDPAPKEAQENKKPIQIRVDPELLKRIDRAAKRLGISRSAFIVSSTAEKLESME